jgi:hypothetical protein
MSAKLPRHGGSSERFSGNRWPRWVRERRRLPALPRSQEGRWGYILAWLIGVPVPILVVIYLLRGCT